jgi:predicted kinase
VLISLSGLPGTGKSTVARLAATELSAVYLRIDSIEQPMLRAGFAVEGVGYEVAHAVASDNLALGRTVVADCVNPWPLTRDAWRTLAQRLGMRVVEIEFVCSDVTEHRRRVEARHVADPRWPSWQNVLDRDYRPWVRERVVIDTAQISVEGAVALLVSTAGKTQPALPRA